jgi:hypothetical protein
MSPSFRFSSASERDALPSQSQRQRSEAEVVGCAGVECNPRVASGIRQIAPRSRQANGRQRIRRHHDRHHPAFARLRPRLRRDFAGVRGHQNVAGLRDKHTIGEAAVSAACERARAAVVLDGDARD